MRKKLMLLLCVTVYLLFGLSGQVYAEDTDEAFFERFLSEYYMFLEASIDASISNGNNAQAAGIWSYDPNAISGLMINDFAWTRNIDRGQYWRPSAYECGEKVIDLIDEMYAFSLNNAELIGELAPIQCDKYSSLAARQGGGVTIMGLESAYIWMEIGEVAGCAIYPFVVIDDGVYETAHYLYFALVLEDTDVTHQLQEWVVADQDKVYELLKLILNQHPGIDAGDREIMELWCGYHEQIQKELLH